MLNLTQSTIVQISNTVTLFCPESVQYGPQLEVKAQWSGSWVWHWYPADHGSCQSSLHSFVTLMGVISDDRFMGLGPWISVAVHVILMASFYNFCSLCFTALGEVHRHIKWRLSQKFVGGLVHIYCATFDPLVPSHYTCNFLLHFWHIFLIWPKFAPSRPDLSSWTTQICRLGKKSHTCWQSSALSSFYLLTFALVIKISAIF